MKINDKFYFFWDGFCSQWHPCTFEFVGVTYNCAEQAMMNQKALFFGDIESSIEIMKSKSPSVQKSIGRKVSNFDPKLWSEACLEIVTQINVSKFNQNPKMKKQLIELGDREIVEASPYDKIWGIGMKDTHPDILDRDKWQGQNLLGIAIMEAKKRLNL
jgi:ribA/ribD-fused uncharacterized protein